MEISRLLIKHGALVNKCKSDTGSTALYIASQNGHTDTVDLLLQNGADTNKARIHDGATPLYIASQKYLNISIWSHKKIDTNNLLVGF